MVGPRRRKEKRENLDGGHEQNMNSWRLNFRLPAHSTKSNSWGKKKDIMSCKQSISSAMTRFIL